MPAMRPAVLILASLVLSAGPAFAQVAPQASKPPIANSPAARPQAAKPQTLTPEAKLCQLSIGTLREAALKASKLAPDPPAALKARAGLSPVEATARKDCTGFPIPLQLIDTTKEDLDISLGNGVPACKAAIDVARPHMASAQKVLQTHDVALASKVRNFLAAARKGVDQPCKDYPGVASRLLRAENDMIGMSGAH